MSPYVPWRWGIDCTKTLSDLKQTAQSFYKVRMEFPR